MAVLAIITTALFVYMFLAVHAMKQNLNRSIRLLKDLKAVQ